jgi:hypothetical protein
MSVSGRASLLLVAAIRKALEKAGVEFTNAARCPTSKNVTSAYWSLAPELAPGGMVVAGTSGCREA